MLAIRTCLDDTTPHDSLVAEMRRELAEAGSVLVLMRQYMRELVGSSHNESRPLMKFRRLFELGTVPEVPSGHHYGVTLGLRVCNLRGPQAEFGNLLSFLLGVAIGRPCPWVGKSFAPMSLADREQTIDTQLPADLLVARGINHFNHVHAGPTNRAGSTQLTSMLPLTKASAADHERWGHERDGGHFVSHRAPSVYPGTPREVLRLDYRHVALHNNLPLPWMIDELVEVTEGIYLGQWIFDSRSDPEPQHFGYFLLFDPKYDNEARELFPHLEIPAAVIQLNKFKALTLTPEADVDTAQFEAIRRDLTTSGTVLDMLKNYSDELQHASVNDPPALAKLHTLFNAGIAPERMSGFWYGGRLSWQSHGVLGALDVDNIAWHICRPLSPWTGKCFDPISSKRLDELTEGHETQPESIQLCTNTVAFRRLRERAVHGMMKAMHLWVEDADEQERREHGYDAKAFFSLGKPARSVAAENHGKQVYQLNYRWKSLRNPAPDFLCIDEIVQIAEGLYLGRVYYSTKPSLSWTPDTDPAECGYQLFEYFLLMDEQWQACRLRLGFDLDNL